MIREPVVAAKSTPVIVRKSLARRRVYVHGDWHLWIYCCDWVVFSGHSHVGDSSARMKIRKAAEFLNGQKLTHFSISVRKASCMFKFDLGGILKTMPHDSESRQWLLYEPSQKVLSVRADGHYQYVPSDLPEDHGEWKRL
ncbi:MAG: hypothetical protein DMG37_02765 [Acidobacteria bacterium]|nr:MAG: hypothetical protein DMG37_02765 [Acidobacteriota bacterium]